MSFIVIAPRAMLDGGKPVAEIRPGISQPRRRSSRPIAGAFKDLPSAAAAFDTALAKITA